MEIERLKDLNKQNAKALNDFFQNEGIKKRALILFPYHIFENDKSIDSNLFFKYGDIYKNNKQIDEEEIEIIYQLASEDDHIFLRFFENYLFATSVKYRKQSCLFEICNEFIDYYFEMITDFQDLIGVINLADFVALTIYKLPERKQELGRRIFDFYVEAINNKINHLRSLREINCILSHKKLGDIFSREQLTEIYEKIVKVEKADSSIAVSTFELFTQVANRNRHECKDIIARAKADMCRFFILNFDAFPGINRIQKANEIINIMDESGSYSDEDYLNLYNIIENENEKIIQHMKSRSRASVNSNRKALLEELMIEFNKLDDDEKMYKLLELVKPISSKEINEQLSIIKNSLVYHCIVMQITTNEPCGNIIESKDSIFKGFIIRNIVKFEVENTIKLFIENINITGKVEAAIRGIVENSKLEALNKVKLTKMFVQCFKSKFSDCNSEIILGLEESLRKYFINEKMNVRKKNKTRELIGLSDILREKEGENNIYKIKLLERINEDYYFSLSWLLADRDGANIRNKLAHGYSECDRVEIAYVVLLILKLYWAFPKE